MTGSLGGLDSIWFLVQPTQQIKVINKMEGSGGTEHMFMAMSEAKGPETTIFISFYLNQADTTCLNDSGC